MLFIILTTILLTFSSSVTIRRTYNYLNSHSHYRRNEQGNNNSTNIVPATTGLTAPATTGAIAPTPGGATATTGATATNNAPAAGAAGTIDPAAAAAVLNSLTQVAPYDDLVTTKQKPKCTNTSEDPKLPVKDLGALNGGGYFPTSGPYTQANPFKSTNTKDVSYINYVFDYLGEMQIKSENNILLKKMIKDKFEETFKAAQGMSKDEPSLRNPYTPAKLLFYFSKGAAGEQPFMDPRLIDTNRGDNAQIATPSGMVPPLKTPVTSKDSDPVNEEVWGSIKALNKNFDRELYLKSITMIQLYHIFREWGWGTVGNDIFEIKKILDTYDFNGDGALNEEEFTILQIKYTIKSGRQCRLHCFKKIIEKVLEPLFMYLDCDSDGFINSSNIWEGYKNILREPSDKYNMYKCQFPVELNKDYRTNSTNDLVLKGHFTADGFLTKNEFIKVILSGFWERMCSPGGYAEFNTEAKTGVDIRWGNNGIEDTECDKIMKYFPQKKDVKN